MCPGLFFRSIEHYKASFHMRIQALMRCHVFLYDVIYRGGYDSGLSVLLDLLKRDPEELVEILVVIVLYADLKSIIRLDIFAVEFEFL